jgi:hypothetical protein
MCDKKVKTSKFRLGHFSFLKVTGCWINHALPIVWQHQVVRFLIFSDQNSQILSSSGQIQISEGISQTDDFSFNEVSWLETVTHNDLID